MESLVEQFPAMPFPMAVSEDAFSFYIDDGQVEIIGHVVYELD